MTVENTHDNIQLIKISNILVYNHIPTKYYTDGTDIFIEIKKEANCKFYRVKLDSERFYIKTQKDCPTNYFLLNDKLYKKMKWQIDKNGYLFFSCFYKKKTMKISQHRLVYFYNNNIVPNKDMVVDHIDRNKQNNNISNLRLVTFAMNSNNIDKKLQSISRSKYLYKIIKIKTQEIIGNNLTAGEVQNLIGLDCGLVNKYMKKHFIYKGEYRIDKSTTHIC